MPKTKRSAWIRIASFALPLALSLVGCVALEDSGTGPQGPAQVAANMASAAPANQGAGAVPTPVVPVAMPTGATAIPGPAAGKPSAFGPVSGATVADQVLDLVNQARALVGDAPVTLDATMTAACAHHAHYLVINKNAPQVQGLNAHHEDTSLPGSTPDGANAGTHSDITWDDPVAGVSAMIGSLYHRTPMLDSRVTRIGFATEQDASGYEASVLMFDYADRPSTLVGFPAAGQTGVELGFRGETPDPLPSGVAAGAVGYPITLAPPDGESFSDVQASVTDSHGNAVPVYVSDDANPAANFPQGGIICLFPRQLLLPGETYVVDVHATLAGAAGHWAWPFSTEERQTADAWQFDALAPLALHAVSLSGDVTTGTLQQDGSLQLQLSTPENTWVNVVVPADQQPDMATYVARRVTVDGVLIPTGIHTYTLTAARSGDLQVSTASPPVVSATDDAALHQAAGHLSLVTGVVDHAGVVPNDNGTVYLAFMPDTPDHSAFIPADIWQQLQLGDPGAIAGKTVSLRCVPRSTYNDTTIELDVSATDQVTVND